MTARRTETFVPYTADQMYALVADIEHYPDFLPWCAALRVVNRSTDPAGREVVTADMVVTYKVFRERFRSRATLDKAARRVDTQYVDGPFRHLKNFWAFEDQPDGGARVDFEIDFEFRNIILQKTAQAVFDRAFLRMSEAFVKRADAVYGPQASA